MEKIPPHNSSNGVEVGQNIVFREWEMPPMVIYGFASSFVEEYFRGCNPLGRFQTGQIGRLRVGHKGVGELRGFAYVFGDSGGEGSGGGGGGNGPVDGGMVTQLLCVPLSRRPNCARLAVGNYGLARGDRDPRPIQGT
jgi:hypothetical protein